jgi:hypothetical protein
LIVLVAVFFFAMGAVALVAPQQVLATFGVVVTTRDGRNEIRAVYGGFGVAIAALLLIARTNAGIRAGALLAVAVALLGMAFGRLVAAVVDGRPGFYPWVFFGVELLLAAALGAALAAGS